MKLEKLLRILGILLIIYALLSGFHFVYTVNDSGSNFESGYSVKIFALIIGFVLYYFGKRLQEKESS